MVEKIKQIKDDVLMRMEKSINERGIDRADTKELGELADIVKDLAQAEKYCMEAEYYTSVTNAMGSQGYMPEGDNNYMPDSMGYTRGRGRSRSGYRDSIGRYARRGYSMGYHDELDGIREAMNNANPEEREKMKRELRQMAEM